MDLRLNLAEFSGDFRTQLRPSHIELTISYSVRGNECDSPSYARRQLVKMSDDEADPELLELLRQSLGLSKGPENEISSDTGRLLACYLPFSTAPGEIREQPNELS